MDAQLARVSQELQIARRYRIEVYLGHLAVIRKEAGELTLNIAAHVRCATVISTCQSGLLFGVAFDWLELT